MIAGQSVVVRSGVRLVGPLAITVAVYLLFAGHNQPGGGFAAGLVVAALVALRSVVGLSSPESAAPWMAAGGIIAGGIALAPLVVGRPILDQAVVEWTVPLLGRLKSGSALIFDVGVALIVVGLVIAVLDAFDADDPNDDRGAP